LLKPHYVTWSEQQRIERHSPQFLRNIVRILTETGLRINKELLPMRKNQLDVANATVWIPDSKTENGGSHSLRSPWMRFEANFPFLDQVTGSFRAPERRATTTSQQREFGARPL
jgi:integrase